MHVISIPCTTIFISTNTTNCEAPISCHFFSLSRHSFVLFCFALFHLCDGKKCTFHTICGILFSDSLTFVWFNILFTQMLNECDSTDPMLHFFRTYFRCRLRFNKQNWHHNKTATATAPKPKKCTKNKAKNDAEKLVYVYVSNCWNLFAKKFKLNNSKSNIWKLVACSSQRLHCFSTLVHRLAVDTEYLLWIAVVIWWHCSKCHNFWVEFEFFFPHAFSL